MTQDHGIANMQELLSSIATAAKEKTSYYFDMNYLREQKTSLMLDTKTSNTDKSRDCGVKIRVWDGEKFLEQGTDILTREHLEEKLNSLLKQADDNQETIKHYEELTDDTNSIQGTYGPSIEQDITSWNINEKYHHLQELHEQIHQQKPDLLNLRCVYRETIDEHLFVNAHKCMSQRVPVVLIAYIGFVKGSDDNPKSLLCATVNADTRVFSQAKEKISGFIGKLTRLERSKPLPGGRYDVVLSPHLSGLLAHESFGHGMEADTMMKGRALASAWKGTKAGNEEINIVDDPAMDGCHGTLYFDQDGEVAHKTYLVKDGIIHDPIADLYARNKEGLPKSGNGRMESYDHKHYTRMTNTYFESGSHDVSELFSAVEDGLYITESNGGMEDPKGWGVQIQNCFAQRIKDGQLVDEFYDGFTISGFLPEIMGNIEAIGNDFDIDDIGYCGKGHKEYVRVSSGGPSLLIRKVMLG